MPRQQEFICGLSYEVTIAVLPRLNMEELMFELNRRVQVLDKENSIKDRLVSILRDVMLEEYRQLQSMSEVRSPDKTNIPVQDQETATMQENVLTAYAETTSSETSSPDASQQSSGLDIVIKKESDTSSDLLVHTKEPGFDTEQDCENIATLPQDNNSQINAQRYVCDVCGFHTTHARYLSQHKKRHKGEKPFMCGECGYRACHERRLVEHMRTHTEKPFKCDQCNYKTSFKSILVEHMKRHTDEKPYSCDICDYKAYRKSKLEIHMMCHFGVKPYKCEECEYRTADKANLYKHRRLHTGERPFSCQECDYKARQKINLIRHMKRKHL
ncbi:zinc finger protein 436-like [Branchiostoma floridae]|uniref:Zinc finger protein 436-like n=1 Tax=Branchiostoma floridae TaxID=7739 RepID=A0A9J7HSR4_BRAFL|nr:zinc finger protein 436-like [Branchiostoma floridae]